MRKYRPKIGVPFNYDDSWIGGTYYIKNLISSLNLLAESEKPEIWMLSHNRESFEFIQKNTGYKYLNWMQPAFLSGIDGGISRRARFFSLLTPWFLKKKLRFDMIFPYPIDTRWQQTACWIPDFQDKVLPEFFSSDELIAREKQHRQYFENYQHLVFSSDSARHDFERFYPEAKINSHVVHFAVFEPHPEAANAPQILQNYNLTKPFFYCPNQFWIHKNHDVVVRAVGLLKRRGINVVVAFSGKEHDHRAPNYTAELKARVTIEGLEQNILFLGFIPREDQMVIFREATCVIQPSLFEGWSTVIEDAKSVSQYILASRIPANVEQAEENIEFFDPLDAEALADLMARCTANAPVRTVIDYRRYQTEFAHKFMDVVKSVMWSNKSSSLGANQK